MERRLAAVLAADVVGYSRLMGRDEAGTLSALRAHLDELIAPQIKARGGRIVKLMGDGVLAEFPSVVEAVQCAVEIQTAMAQRNTAVQEDARIAFRIGVNIGDVISEGGDIYGDGVNVAARLEALAEPGGICVRLAVRDEIRDRLPYHFDDLGLIEVKNIARPLHVFRLRFDGSSAPPERKARPARRRMLAILAGTLLLLAAVGWGLFQYFGNAPEEAVATVAGQSGVPSIAVLPFANLSPAPDDAFFADGLTDDLINDLAKISGLEVIARSSVYLYKGTAVKVQDVARDLGVRYVLEGSVRRADDTVRINVQLADGATGRQIWAERYDRSESQIFQLQDAVIAEIVEALAVTLTEGEQARVTRVPTTNLDAYDSYLKAEAIGIHTMDWTQMQDALDHYRRAIELDPKFAEAYAGYARANTEVWRFGFVEVAPGPVARTQAYEAASQALALDPHNARAYSVLSLIQLTEGLHDDALASARSAVALAPSDPDARANLAYVLAYAGERAASVDELAKTLRLAPRPSESLRLLAGVAYFNAGDDQKAIDLLAKSSDGGPRSEEGKIFLAAAYARAGRPEAAQEVLQSAIAVYPAANIHYFHLYYDFYRRPADREALLAALAATGLPTWPYGFEAAPEDRVTGDELRGLVIGRTWTGQHHNGSDFLQFIDDQGRLVYRSATSFITGSASLEGDRLCIAIEGHLLGRKVCGEVYRRRAEDNLPYAFVSPDSLRYFDVSD